MIAGVDLTALRTMKLPSTICGINLNVTSLNASESPKKNLFANKDNSAPELPSIFDISSTE
jgi:hypothetical protein